MTPATLPACRPAQIAPTTDARNGDFDGMSHSGTLLVLRNRGPRACGLPGLPRIGFLDARGHAIPSARAVPVGTHPRPAAVTLARGAVASTPLRWVSGQVFDGGRCYAVRAVTVTLAGRTLRAPLTAQLCAAAGKPAGFDQPVLQPRRSPAAG